LLFGGLGIATLVPATVLLDVAGSNIGIYLLVQVVAPAAMASAVFAVAAVVLQEHRSGRAVSLRDASRTLRPRTKEIFAAGLLAGMISLALVVFLRQWGLLLLPLAFGPPIVIQVVALEKASLQEALPRAASLTKGSTGRVISYLFAVSLAIALLDLALLLTIASIVDGTVPTTVAVTAAPYIYGVVQVLVVAITLPYLAAASYTCYDELESRGSGEEGPSGVHGPETLPDP